MLPWLLACVGLVWAGMRVFAGYPAAGDAKRLAPRELACLDAAGEALFPPGGGIEASGADARVSGYVDRLVAASQPRTRLLMRLLFFLVEHATLIFPAPGGLRGLRRFSSLDLEQRAAALEAWRSSRWFARRLVFTSLRALLTLGYFAHPPVLAALRLEPFEIDSPICAADCLYPRIGASRESIPYRAEDVTAPRTAPPLGPDAPRISAAGTSAEMLGALPR